MTPSSAIPCAIKCISCVTFLIRKKKKEEEKKILLPQGCPILFLEIYLPAKFSSNITEAAYSNLDNYRQI